MDFVSIETPASGVSFAGKLPEFFNTSLGVVATGQLSQVVANQLIEALSQSLRPLPGTRGQLLVDRESDIHLHSICAH